MGTVNDGELEILQRYLAAWGSGDVMTVLGLYHEELELHWPGKHRLSGSYIGRDAAVTALFELQIATQRALLEVRSISADNGVADVADVADVELVERWTVDERIVDVPRRLRFGVRDDLIASCSVVEHEPEQVDLIIG